MNHKNKIGRDASSANVDSEACSITRRAMVQHTTLLGLGSLLPMGNLFAVVSAKGDSAANEDGYRAWLRYEPLEASKRSEYRRLLGGIVVHGDSASIRVAAEELQRGLSGLLGQPVPNMKTLRRGSVLVGDSGSEFIRNTITPDTLNGLGIEGYVLKQVPVAGGGAIVIAGLTGRGTLYGVFHFLRLLQTHSFIDELDLKEIPSSPLRLVNHWDNLDKDRNTDGLPIGSTGEESGTKQSPDRLLRFHNSLWKWDELPERLSPRYRDYARLLASTYINGIVVNNVNTSKHGLTGWKLLTKPYIQKVAALADVFRSYGVRLYLAVGFDSPMLIDQLQTGDPLDAGVRQWWREKADELYAAIPDFGGFLVKADSEMEPGPAMYNRTPAQGANMLGQALKPHHGVVMWRTFVYGDALKDFPAEVRNDRARQAYDYFHPMDGQFEDNVVLQVKHGPIDFGMREPVSPLFGAMPRTNLMMEGWDYWAPGGGDAAILYLAPMWKQVLDFDTYSKGRHSTVKRIISGHLNGNPLGGSAMVITVGDVPNWTGQQMHMANVFAYGQFCWHADASVQKVTEQWIQMTFNNDPVVVRAMSDVLLSSWDIVADYTAPLGLGGPMNGKVKSPPERTTWSGFWPRPEERTHNDGADAKGVGINRTETGSKYTLQYTPEARAPFESAETCPVEEILFFHHLPYTYRLRTGDTVSQSLYATLASAVQRLERSVQSWERLEKRIDDGRYRDGLRHLQMHLEDARVWRDVMTNYFVGLSSIPDQKPPRLTRRDAAS